MAVGSPVGGPFGLAEDGRIVGDSVSNIVGVSEVGALDGASVDGK